MKMLKEYWTFVAIIVACAGMILFSPWWDPIGETPPSSIIILHRRIEALENEATAVQAKEASGLGKVLKELRELKEMFKASPVLAPIAPEPEWLNKSQIKGD